MMVEFVRTAELDVGYVVTGPEGGRGLVAVHGWPDDVHCWDGVLPFWHEAGYRVYRPFLRGFGPTRFRSADTMRSGQIGALGHDLAAFLEALDLDRVLLVGHDWGARAGYVVGALFPERVAALVALSAGYATNRPDAPLSWPLVHAYWYEWFVATERGRRAMRDDRRSFSRHLWETWAPGWTFGDQEFEQAAAAWDNDDWPPVTVHAYLHRWGRRREIRPTTTSSSACRIRRRYGFRRSWCTEPRTATTCPRRPKARTNCSPPTTNGSFFPASATFRRARRPRR
ncbi:alpha/beta fold hydrolase [Actinomadura yumaensis]|uniref:alpha/beta fold hydrolase n=1 Tax=Actinomadura TaxID=1988 RepID=UPI0019D6205D|nr:alpha/beta hydrolase [Actinomadura sp. J1-007]